MLKATRVRRFPRAASRLLAVLLASVVSIGAAGFGHSGWDDTACDPIVVHHDHNAHRFLSGRLPGGDPDHCLFCHSLRSLGNGLIATHTLVVDVAEASTFRISASATAGRFFDSNAPSRAPPSVLL